MIRLVPCKKCGHMPCLVGFKYECVMCPIFESEKQEDGRRRIWNEAQK